MLREPNQSTNSPPIVHSGRPVDSPLVHPPYRVDGGRFVHSEDRQLDLPLPQRTVETITVDAADIAATEARLRDIGAVVLGFSLKAGIYTLTVIMPPREMIEAQEGQQAATEREP